MRGVKKNDSKILSLPYVFSWNFYGTKHSRFGRSLTLSQSKDNDTAQGF